MTAGGFMFAKASVKYDSTTYPTKRDWGLAVHKARCEAFIKACNKSATKNVHAAWTSINTGLYDEFTIDIDGTTVYVQDYHPISVDTTGEYPAFVSHFRCPTNSLGHAPEYAIITAHCFHTMDDTSQSYGLKINFNRLMPSTESPSYRYIGLSCCHAYAANGFNSYDVSSDNMMKQGEMYIIPMIPWRATTIYYQGYTDSYYSLVNSPESDLTYYFGYAVKLDTIELFYKLSNFNTNYGWECSVIGRLFGNDCAVSDWPYGAASYGRGNIFDGTMAYTSDSLWVGLESHTSDWSSVMTIGSNGCFPTFTDADHGSVSIRVINPCNLFGVSTSEQMDEIPYSAFSLGFLPNKYYGAVRNDSGLDDSHTLTKGIISTDIMRCVNTYCCKVGGTTFQGGNFVALCPGSSYAGMLVGWDADNESIV